MFAERVSSAWMQRDILFPCLANTIVTLLFGEVNEVTGNAEIPSNVGFSYVIQFAFQ